MTAVTRVDFRRQTAMTSGDTRSDTHVDVAVSQPATNQGSSLTGTDDMILKNVANAFPFVGPKLKRRNC
jgi:hypothetical protein